MSTHTTPTPTVRPEAAPPAAPLMNRWLAVVGAVLIQLCLGAIYAWSVFTNALVKPPFGFSATQTQVIFSVGLATFALVMLWGGTWQARVGPTLVVRVGGLLLALGYVLAKFVGTSFPGLLITLGVIGGAGIGLAYIVPIAVGVKWFPDKKGLVTGLAVAGFGFGALIWIELADPGVGRLLTTLGVSNVFLAYGITFFVLIMLGSIWMKNPPDGWLPPGWSGAAGGAAPAAGTAVTFEPGQMMRTPQFYMLWVMFICGALTGLMVIGIIKLFGIDALRARAGMDEKAAGALAATAMGVFFAAFNGVGRIAWGAISEAIGRKRAMASMLVFQGLIMLAFFYMGGVPVLLFLGAACIGFNFGGTLALFPAATADFFGNKRVGKNYPWVFTAYGIGGIVGPIMAGLFKDAAKAVQSSAGEAAALQAKLNAWFPAFIIAGVACLVAAAIALALKPPKPPLAPRPAPVR
jgi:OFA family oxalate/formate antiporter-like MFS transporter